MPYGSISRDRNDIGFDIDSLLVLEINRFGSRRL
jgi:hypothetical protein